VDPLGQQFCVCSFCLVVNANARGGIGWGSCHDVHNLICVAMLAFI
jgi:hypothetical protein